jgi:hypothetical protein
MGLIEFIQGNNFNKFIFGLLLFSILTIIILIIFIIKNNNSTDNSTDNNECNKKSPYFGNKSLDSIYSDAKGNIITNNGLMTSKINLSTKNNSCSFLVTYNKANERRVECTRGCSNKNEEELTDNNKFCNSYRYNDDGKFGLSSENMFDQDSIDRGIINVRINEENNEENNEE